MKAVSFDKAAKSSQQLPFVKTVTKTNKTAELKLAVYIAEHSAIQSVDHLGEILPSIDPKSEVLGTLKIHRTKCSMLIKNVLGPVMMQEMIADVGDSSYSLIADETTDITTDKILCMMIRYFSERKQDIITTFYRFIKISKCDATTIYETIKTSLREDSLRIEMLVGIGLDGTNVMIGEHHSVAALLKRDLPDIIIVNCTCHSLHLCAEKASESLPRQLEFLIRECHNWFSYSSKRLDTYKDLYETMNESRAPKKIPGFCGTRWLARSHAIRTLLEQWEELKLLFSMARTEDKCFMAEQLYGILKCRANHAYFTFLDVHLRQVTKVNCLFQSDNVDPTKLLEDLFLLFKNILQIIVVPRKLESVTEGEYASFDFQAHLMHASSMHLGYTVEEELSKLVRQDKEDVRERCKTFLVILCSELQKRLPKNIAFLKSVAKLSPEIATSQVKPTLVDMLRNVQRVEVYGSKQEVETEWNNLQNKSWQNTTRCIDFWAEVKRDTDAGGNKRFPNISKLALSLLSAPISNAAVERAFSLYSVVKTKLRNRLSLPMIQSIMTVRYNINIFHKSCVNFTPTKAMLDKFNNNMYDKKDNDADAAEETFIVVCQ